MTSHDDIKKMIERIENEQRDTAEQIFSAEGLQKLQETMKQYQGDDRLHWSHEIALALDLKSIPSGFKTGIKALDELTGGFRQKQVITMFAHTKHGKTETAMWLMSLFPDLAPVLIPLEQGAEELISQRKERKYAIPTFLAPLRHDAFVTTQWIEDRVVEGIAKHNSKMNVIDHLGYIDKF